MLDFKAKMHQIQFRLGLRARPRWGSLQRSPDPITGLKWEGERKSGGKGRERKEREREVGEGKGGRGREGIGPQVTVEPGPLRALLRHCCIVNSDV